MKDDPRSIEALKDVIKDWRKWAFFSYSVILDTDNPVIRFRNNRSELIAELDLRKLYLSAPSVIENIKKNNRLLNKQKKRNTKITREAPGRNKGSSKKG